MYSAKSTCSPLAGIFVSVVLLLTGHNGSVAQERSVATKTNSISIKTNPNGVLFSENEKPVLQYQAKPKSKKGDYQRANYIHPLYDLDGNILTEDFPQDHLHHRGIFWAWHQVNVGDIPAGDAWLTKDFEWNVLDLHSKSLANGAAQLTAKVQWRSPKIIGDKGIPQVIAIETTRITIYQASDDCRFVDFEILLTAAQPKVKIGGSDDVKGYGGFSLRIKPPADIEFNTAKGLVEPQKTAMNCGDWVDIVGTFGQSKSKSGVAVFVHPTSAGYPQTWILRSKKSMQNPVYPGRVPVPLSQSKPTVLRYRIAVHKQSLSIDSIQRLFDAYRLIEFGNPEPATSDPTPEQRSAK